MQAKSTFQRTTRTIAASRSPARGLPSKSIGRTTLRQAGAAQVQKPQRTTASVKRATPPAPAPVEAINPEFLAIAEEQEKKPETEDERLMRILAESQASTAKAEKVLQKCGEQGEETKNALEKANTMHENVAEFKEMYRKLNNEMVEKLGAQMGIQDKKVKNATYRGNNLEKDLIKQQLKKGMTAQTVAAVDVTKQKRQTICNCGQSGNAHFKNENCTN